MTWVSRFVEEESDTMWALVHSPMMDGISCIFGEVFTGPHYHALDHHGHPTSLRVSAEEDD